MTTETVDQLWLDKSLSADERASLLVEALTLDEMITLVHGPMPRLMETPPEGAAMGAGYIYGIERLGIPALNETDVGGDEAVKFQKMLDMLDDLDDVQDVYTSAILPE